MTNNLIGLSFEDNFGMIYDKLSKLAPSIAIETIKMLDGNKFATLNQEEQQSSFAPKLFKDNTKIISSKTAMEVYNFIRGLAPYPSAWAEFGGKTYKISKSRITDIATKNLGLIEIGKTGLFLHCKDFKLEILELQPEGKRSQSSKDFINGWRGEAVFQLS